MNFVRKRKRGSRSKTSKYWFSAEDYRIRWRKAVDGVRLPAGFQACVRTVIPNYAGNPGAMYEMWDFVDRHLYKTQRAAQRACETHHRLWSQACQATGIRGLTQLFGRLPIGFPAWIKTQMDPRALEVLCKNPNDRTNRSKTSSDGGSGASPNVGSSQTPTNTPVSDASDGGESTTKTIRRARSKATNSDECSPAPHVKGRAAERKKQPVKHTAQQSKSGRSVRHTTTASPKPAKRRSKSSPQKKSKPSGN